jgi:hypothetical protein
MYWRESMHLAETFGWRVINPNLPGFAGSDPLPWEQVSINGTHQRDRPAPRPPGDRSGDPPRSLHGWSRGRRNSPISTRNGPSASSTATEPPRPNGRSGTALLVSLLSPVAARYRRCGRPHDGRHARHPGRPDRSTPAVDPAGIVARRQPQPAHHGPVAAGGLHDHDHRPTTEVRHVVDEAVPILPIWGCFDRIVNAACAQEFSDLVHRTWCGCPEGTRGCCPGLRPRPTSCATWAWPGLHGLTCWTDDGTLLGRRSR